MAVFGESPDGQVTDLQVMTRVQIQKTRRPSAPVEIDTRTPSGRTLPF